MPTMELDMQQAASAAPADAESRTARAPVVVVVPPAAPAPEPQTSLMVGSAISKTNKKARLSADGAYSVSVNTVPGHITAGTMATSAGAAAEAAFGFAAAVRRVAQEAATAAETAALAAAAARQFAKEAAASAQQAELAAAAAAAAVANGVMIIDDVDDCSLADVPRGASPANASLAPALVAEERLPSMQSFAADRSQRNSYATVVPGSPSDYFARLLETSSKSLLRRSISNCMAHVVLLLVGGGRQ